MGSTKWSIDSFTSNVDTLVSFPAAITRLDEMVSDGVSDAASIGSVLETDPALTAKLLQVANSAAFGARSPVESVERAVAMMGAIPVRNLCMSVASREAFSALDNDIVSLTDFWSHSVYCAATARELAQVYDRRFDPGTAFTAGILHDIGHLLMFHLAPEECQSVVLNALDQPNFDLSQAERDHFGFDHGDVGAALVSQWQLPASLQACVAHHHRPAQATEHADLVALIHAANVIANFAELDDFDPDLAAIEPEVIAQLDLNNVEMLSLVVSINESARALLPLFAT